MLCHQERYSQQQARMDTAVRGPGQDLMQFWLPMVWTTKWNRDRSPTLFRSLSWERVSGKLVISFSKIKGGKGLFAAFTYSKGKRHLGRKSLFNLENSVTIN